jgi:hypothetical protein
VAIAFAAVALTQPLQVGNLPASANMQVGSAPVTVFDFQAPATVSGVLTSATFAYSAFPCPAAVKIKFFRTVGVAVRFLAERGPFDVTQKTEAVALSPPVSVRSGDWVAITRLTDCGSPLADSSGADSLASFPGDVSQDVIIGSGNLTSGLTLALAALGSRTPFDGVAAVIPVVFSGAGAAGSFFRTEAWLQNPTGGSISGHVVFTLQGPRPGGFFPYSLGPYEAQSADLGGSFGNLDIVPTIGPAPLASVHLFNDLGPGGTLGFTESDVPVAEALATGDRGVLLGPPDPGNFRFNIGMRGIPTATISITIRKRDGTLAATKSQTAGVLVQTAAKALIGFPLDPSMTMTFEVTSGVALVYGVTADNRTNDTSFQLARRVTQIP